MKVTLMNKPDCSKAIRAWTTSRPNEKITADTMKQVLALDLPVNEFIPVHLEIESTIFEREVIATMRNHSMWAQTSRVQDVLNFEIDYEANELYHLYEAEFEHKRFQMKREAGSGVRQDEYRLHLPMASKTTYSIMTNYRELCKLARTFETMFPSDHDLKDQFAHFGAWLHGIAYQILTPYFTVGEMAEILASFSPYDLMNREEMRKMAPKKANGVVVVTEKMPFHLRAQLVRHRTIGIVDDFLEVIDRLPVESIDLNTELMVTAYGTERDFIPVLEKRSCWIAHYGIWSNFLSKVESQMEGNTFLPCRNGMCPFDGDAALRFEGRDPNPPCPIHCRLTNRNPTHQQRNAMRQMIIDDKRSVSFWNDQMNELSVEAQP